MFHTKNALFYKGKHYWSNHEDKSKFDCLEESLVDFKVSAIIKLLYCYVTLLSHFIDPSHQLTRKRRKLDSFRVAGNLLLRDMPLWLSLGSAIMPCWFHKRRETMCVAYSCKYIWLFRFKVRTEWLKKWVVANRLFITNRCPYQFRQRPCR